MSLLKDWPFTDQTLQALKDLRNDGYSFTRAAKYLGTRTETLRMKADNAQMGNELEAIYPSKGGEEFRLVETCNVYRGGPRKLKPEQIAVPLDIDRNHIYVRSASMKWRSAA